MSTQDRHLAVQAFALALRGDSRAFFEAIAAIEDTRALREIEASARAVADLARVMAKTRGLKRGAA